MERTTNLSLKKPGLDDDALISDLNDNSDVLDSKIGPVGNVSLQTQISNETTARQHADTSLNDNIAKLREGVAIVVDGDTAAFAVPVGGYAWIRNNQHGLTEGMYKNTSSSAFPVSGGTADSTVFTSVSGGAVNDAFSVLNDKLNQHKLYYLKNYSITLLSDKSTGALNPASMTGNIVTRSNIVGFDALAIGCAVMGKGRSSAGDIFIATNGDAGNAYSFNFVFFYE